MNIGTEVGDFVFGTGVTASLFVDAEKNVLPFMNE